MNDYFMVPSEIGPLSARLAGEDLIVVEAGMRANSKCVEVFGVEYQICLSLDFTDNTISVSSKILEPFYALRKDHEKYKYRKHPSDAAKNKIIKAININILLSCINIFFSFLSILKKIF